MEHEGLRRLNTPLTSAVICDRRWRGSSEGKECGAAHDSLCRLDFSLGCGFSRRMYERVREVLKMLEEHWTGWLARLCFQWNCRAANYRNPTNHDGLPLTCSNLEQVTVHSGGNWLTGSGWLLVGKLIIGRAPRYFSVKWVADIFSCGCASSPNDTSCRLHLRHLRDTVNVDYGGI